MGTKRTGDNVPRPRDSAARCVERIRAGHTHAVVDLIEALDREDDPRLDTLTALLRNGMETLREWPDPATRATATVTVFQQLAVNCVRVMLDPNIQKQAENVRRRLGVGRSPR